MSEIRDELVERHDRTIAVAVKGNAEETLAEAAAFIACYQDSDDERAGPLVAGATVTWLTALASIRPTDALKECDSAAKRFAEAPYPEGSVVAVIALVLQIRLVLSRQTPELFAQPAMRLTTLIQRGGPLISQSVVQALAVVRPLIKAGDAASAMHVSVAACDAISQLTAQEDLLLAARARVFSVVALLYRADGSTQGAAADGQLSLGVAEDLVSRGHPGLEAIEVFLLKSKNDPFWDRATPSLIGLKIETLDRMGMASIGLDVKALYVEAYAKASRPDIQQLVREYRLELAEARGQ